MRMSRGWDVSELLAKIKDLSSKIDTMLPQSLTDEEIRVAISALREVHAPEPAHHEMRQDASRARQDASRAIAKLEGALRRSSDQRRIRAELVESLTEDELQAIRDMRARKDGVSR